jgi:hypothetical protein
MYPRTVIQLLVFAFVWTVLAWVVWQPVPTDLHIAPLSQIVRGPLLMERHPFSEEAWVISQPTEVEARRIHTYLIHNTGGPGGHITEKLGPAVRLNPTIAKLLSSVIGDPCTYVDGIMIQCFEPGVEYEFHRSEYRVRVRICFHCQNLVADFTDTHITRVGNPRVFRPGYARLAQITKVVFPLDDEIQSINEHAGEK